MAVRAVTLGANVYGVVIFASWYGLAVGDSGTPIAFTDWADRSVQVIGTFDGATLVIEGSNDGSTFSPLHDPFGDEAECTAAELIAIAEIARVMRPRVDGGGGSTSLAVHLVARRNNEVQRVLNDSRIYPL